jgi:hypothetical protein
MVLKSKCGRPVKRIYEQLILRNCDLEIHFAINESNDIWSVICRTSTVRISLISVWAYVRYCQQPIMEMEPYQKQRYISTDVRRSRLNRADKRKMEWVEIKLLNIIL